MTAIHSLKSILNTAPAGSLSTEQLAEANAALKLLDDAIEAALVVIGSGSQEGCESDLMVVDAEAVNELSNRVFLARQSRPAPSLSVEPSCDPIPTPSNNTPMFILDEHGQYIAAEYDPSLLTFVFEGTEIRDPFTSECSRFEVDPVAAYGFTLISTGGGCEGLARAHEGGGYIFLANSDGLSRPDQKATANLARYDADGQQVAYIAAKDIPMDF
jgi:hypothetical protein